MMKRKAAVLLAVAVALAGVAIAPAAVAGPYGRHWGEAYHFHYDAAGWRGGRWVQSWHGGRYGWWWLVGASWLLYPGPVYPYPSPDAEPVYVINDTPAAVQAVPAAPAPAQVWYYCRQPQGYYPYVPACPSGWQTVPAQPQDLH